jgi:hypothetical protein
MKKINIFLSLFLCYSISNAQLVNNGATVEINAGAQLLVKGNLTNGTGSNLVNNGTIMLSGNLVNNQVMTAPNAGMLSFEGSSLQVVSGSADYYANNILINNAAGITLSTRLKVAGECNFTSGVINATNALYPVLVTFTGSVSSVNAPTDISHVSGYVVKEGTGSFTYPTGNGTKYQKVSVDLTANTNGVSGRYISADAGAAPFTGGGTSSTPLFAYNTQEYWELIPAGTAAGAVTVYWDNYKNSGITGISDLTVAHKSGGAWLNEGAAFATGNVLAGSVTGNSISIWSPFTLGSTSAASALPVKLQSFTAFASGGENILQWHTEVEEPGMTFYLQRSEKGQNFSGFKTIVSAGNPGAYAEKDDQPYSPITYYRLKITSVTGADIYSDVVPVHRKDNSFISVVPSPASSVVKIINTNDLLNGKVASVIDMQGKERDRFILKSVQQINISKWASGAYILKLSDGTTVQFVKQ